MLNYQNNCVERSNQLLEYQNLLQHCSLFLRSQQNYFDSLTKLFSDLYPAKFSISKIVFFALRSYSTEKETVSRYLLIFRTTPVYQNSIKFSIEQWRIPSNSAFISYKQVPPHVEVH